MAFKGTLKEFKVPDILQLISLQKKTGILTFTSSDRFVTLIFQEGLIVGVDAFPKKLEMRVGTVFVKQDFISEEMLQRALSIQKRTNQKIGEILLSMGLIDKEAIQNALKTQAVQIVLSLFKWKKGEYNFKIMTRLDESIKIIEPIPTDNIVMEGVQMLDEWPLIKKSIPNENMVFEPIPVNIKNIEIIDEYEDEKSPKEGKIFLTETETNILKYINGKNAVKDLVELGIFTEYKVYKSIFNLIKKSIIQAKEKAVSEDLKIDQMFDELKVDKKDRINRLYRAFFILIILLFGLTLLKPLKPFKSDNVLIKKELYRKIFTAKK